MAARYTTDDEIVRVLPAYLRLQLADDSHAGTETVGLVAEVQENADDYLDGCIQAAGFYVPVAGSVPPFVRHCALGVFRYLIHERVGAMDEFIERAYERTIADLDKLVAGGRRIGLDPVPSPSTRAAQTTLTSQTMIYGRSNLEGL